MSKLEKGIPWAQAAPQVCALANAGKAGCHPQWCAWLDTKPHIWTDICKSAKRYLTLTTALGAGRADILTLQMRKWHRTVQTHAQVHHS